ncbi:MAG: SUMF1/EgtB/PvdO family nonheme iron enzyme [Phycisphaerales bacterium JB037]
MSQPSCRALTPKAGLLAAATTASLLATSTRAQIEIEWVTVRDAGNPADAIGFGAVGYDYRIGRHEVTNAQYAAFLNAVAASDPHGLYQDAMGTNLRGGITRTGIDGSYVYSVKANMGDKPVIFVSWYDAARFCNWMTNGQGSGSTELGVYTFTGTFSISAITRAFLDPDAPTNPNEVFIPTENEWHKAAYHHPAAQGGDADGYWRYATASNSIPAVATATIIGDVANPGPNVANYAAGAVWNGVSNVTTAGSAGAASFYGAFDMSGNVSEWTEGLPGGLRDIRGGSWNTSSFELRSDASEPEFPAVELRDLGFRVASPLPPACPADLTGSSDPNDPSFGQPDGVADSEDFFFYLDAFIAAQLATCDLTGSADPNDPSFGAPNGLCDGDDFFYYLDLFVAGCP